ncbi:MAG: hypothetical protein GEU28_13370 [Dehalococcoidia bacterium]|nr:hypothetical protein [Dehalococcoidia bacterium]
MRFPKWEDKKTTASAGSRPSSQASITGLFEGWWKEVSAGEKRSESTREAYERSVKKLVGFLGHDDASQVAPEDVVAFKDARLAEINPPYRKAGFEARIMTSAVEIVQSPSAENAEGDHSFKADLNTSMISICRPHFRGRGQPPCARARKRAHRPRVHCP